MFEFTQSPLICFIPLSDDYPHPHHTGTLHHWTKSYHFHAAPLRSSSLLVVPNKVFYLHFSIRPILSGLNFYRVVKNPPDRSGIRVPCTLQLVLHRSRCFWFWLSDQFYSVTRTTTNRPFGTREFIHFRREINFQDFSSGSTWIIDPPSCWQVPIHHQDPNINFKCTTPFFV